MSNSFQRGRKKAIQPSASKSNHTTLYSNHILSKQVNYKPKNKFQRSSSFSSSSNDSDSVSSKEMRKKRFLEEDDSFSYPTRKDVGLDSSGEESSDMESPLKDNLENEIERNIIEIYNKNISNCRLNNGNGHCSKCDRINNYRNKRNRGLSNGKKELKSTFKQLNEHYNLFVLQVLSRKIKELVNKYKEKILEIPEIAIINSKYKNIKTNNKSCLLKKNLIPNKNILHSPQYRLSNIILHNEINELNIASILPKELINIKHTLKRSSFEIQQIFKYPLSLLHTKFSIEKIHLDAYHTILLQDELIASMIEQIKKSNNRKINKLISLIEDDSSYKDKEMEYFDKEINVNEDELNVSNEEIIKKNNTTPTSSSTIEYQDNKIDSDIDIDKLIKYIDSDEGETVKKKKKKRNRNKKKIPIEEDKIVSIFKEEINKYSVDSFLYQKIRPKYSEEWIRKLNNI